MQVYSYPSTPQSALGNLLKKSSRIAVVDILQWLVSGMTLLDIMDDYPSLKQEQILAAFAFAVNKESIIKMVAA